MKVISNNPFVLKKIEDNHPVSGNPLDVLLEVRKFLESGHKLVTMPLPANQRLFMNPYRSILVDKSSKDMDMKGLVLLEKAVERFRSQVFYDDQGADGDFALMDLEQVMISIKMV